MSALPKSVQAQIDKANEIANAVYPKKTPEEIAAEQAAEAAALDPANAKPAAKPEKKPEKPAAETPPAEPAVPETADHKYKVLQGKYNAEVPRLQAQIRDQNELITEMRQRINNTESLLAAMHTTDPKAKETPAPANTSPGITDEERAQFGPDLIDVIERVAAHRLLPEIDSRFAPLKTSMEKVSQSASQAEKTVAVSKRERTIQALADAVPSWAEQNEDEGFLTWLNEKDVYAGVPRGQLLTQAFTANDANRVIAIFKGFQNENAVVTPSTSTPPVVEPQVRLDELTAPGTPKTGTTSAPNESGKRQWSRNDISAFYAKKNEFVTRGKPIPEEFQKLERDLIAAQREGRIR